VTRGASVRAATLGLGLAAAIVHAADPRPLGGEFQVNAGLLGDWQGETPDIAAGGGGTFVVAWSGGGYYPSRPVFVRAFDAVGNPTSGNVIVTDPLAPSSDDAL
jgi:hypothetical protein